MKTIALVSLITISLILPLVICQNATALLWDFSDKGQINHWKAINGEWKIEDGKLKGTLGPDYIGIICTYDGSSNWTDYTFSAETEVPEGKYTYWMVRVQSDPLSYYAFERSHSNSTTVWRRDAGQHAKLASGDALPAGHLDKHTWKIEVKDDNISVLLDDKLLAEAQDSTYKKGTIGLGGHNMDSATGKNVILFDNISVDGEGIPKSLGIAPVSRFATSWANIKARYQEPRTSD